MNLIVNFLKQIFYKIVHKNFSEHYGRHIILEWCRKYVGKIAVQNLKILDIGCGFGDDLINIKKGLTKYNVELFGIEQYPLYVEKAKQRGINVISLDIERNCFPFPNEYFDIIIANQIIEHTKEIFLIFSEISRTVKKEGIIIVGVPNLAAWHNRILLLMGHQPIPLEILGPHVRGFTFPSFKKFIEADEFFKVIEIAGSNFYPFPPRISRFFAKLFPTFCVSIFFLIRRTTKKGEFIEVLKTRFFETLYYTGNNK